MNLWIPGIPKSTQTGSIVRLPGGRAFPSRRNTPWSAYVREMMATNAPNVLMDGPLCVDITFIMPDLATGKREFPVKRPDLDNLLKGLLDCGNGILWQDDAQIVDLTLGKRYARNTDQQAPGVHIIVWEKV